MVIPFWIHLWEYSPCISCRPLRTDPPRTLCPHGSPCCSFWRCWGFWWRCGPRRAWCPCPASTRWRSSWWQRWHLQQVDEEGEKWERHRRGGRGDAGRFSAFIQIQTAAEKHRWRSLSDCSYCYYTKGIGSITTNVNFSHYCTDTMWDMKHSTRWLQSCSTTYEIWGFLLIVEDYLQVHNKNFDCNRSILSLTRPVIHYHQLSSTHQGPSGTPRSYHWKSFSNIRSDRQASWLFSLLLSLLPVIEEVCCGCLLVAECRTCVQKASIWTKLAVIRLSARFHFFPLEKAFAPPTPPPSADST